MVNETIRMDVYHDYYEVTVDFLFQNHGPAVTVKMGFPESGGGDIMSSSYAKHSGFSSFHTWVDNQQVTAVRKVDFSDDGYRAFWVKTVSFAKGQARRVRVSYQSDPGDDTTGYNNVFYTFSGGNWAGRVQESKLLVTLHLPDTNLIEVRELPDEKAMVDSQSHGNLFTAIWKNWKATGDFSLGYRTTYPGWFYLKDMQDMMTPNPETDILTQPGKAPRLDWLPPGVIRNGVAFIQLSALANYLNMQAEKVRQEQQAELQWDPKSYTGILLAGAHKLRFQLKHAEMIVNDTRKVPLEVPPFLSRPSADDGQGSLYVPLLPALKALGGTAQLDAPTHCARLEIPPFWKTMTTAHAR